MRSTLRRLYSFSSALCLGIIMMTPFNRRHDAHARARYRRGVHGPRSEPLRRLHLGLRVTARQTGTRRDVSLLTSLSPCPLSPRWRPATPSGCLPLPHSAFAPSAGKDITLRWVIRGWIGILLICHARMRGVLIWPRLSEAATPSHPPSPPSLFPLFRSDGGRFDDA